MVFASICQHASSDCVFLQAQAVIKFVMQAVKVEKIQMAGSKHFVISMPARNSHLLKGKIVPGNQADTCTHPPTSAAYSQPVIPCWMQNYGN